MMSEDSTELVRKTVDTVYRSDSSRILATLIRLLGDFDLAEKELIDGILSRGELVDYHLAHSARADLCRRLGKK